MPGRIAGPAGRAIVGLVAVVLAASGCGGGSRGAGGAGGRGPTLHTSDGAEYLAHEVVVRLPAGVSDEALVRELAKLGGRIVESGGPLGELGYRRVSLPNNVTADVAVSDLVAGGMVSKAEPNYIVEASGMAVAPSATAAAAKAMAAATATDPRFGELWGMTKIEAPAAWDISTGSTDVLVAVSDTGIDYTHPDLAANAWTNPGEIPGNGRDDDGNGYVDDVYGYDFANNDADPRDDHGHGTHVSGTIGAVANNGQGVAGVNWRVKILGAKFLDARGSGTTWNGAQTILYAAKMKARVLNASWGCLGSGCYASYLEDAIKTLEKAGGIFIAAAGNAANDNDATPNYPSNYTVPSLVAVAATDSKDALASFSDWGATRVHVAAPGVGILSTTPNNTYASWNGTSMATPHVAGAAALFLSVRPDATPLDIKQKLMETCDPVAGLAGRVATGGRINVRRLVASAGKTPAAPNNVEATPGGRADVLLSWSPNSESDLANYRVRWGTATGRYTATLDVNKTLTSARVTDLVPGTRYFFIVQAVSTTGLVSAPSVERDVLVADSVAPAQVVDLMASPIPGGEASGEVTAASGEFSSFWVAANAHDGSVETAWISPRRDEPQEEAITVGLFTPFVIEAVDLVPSAAYPDFFPPDFDVEISADGQDFRPVGGLRGAKVVAGEHVRVVFPPTVAAQVRVRVLRPARHSSGYYYAALAEIAIFETSSVPDGLRLSFTAPGDDPGRGRAARYDVRRSTAPITEQTFAAGVSVPASGQPLGSGVREEINVAPLAGETTYFFALKAIDQAGNVSPMSNVASAATLVVPPSTVTDLRALEAEAGGDAYPGSVTLTWTAPGADGKQGQAARYDIRMSTMPLSPGDFTQATPLLGAPVPAPGGSTERFAISDLEPGETYYFALRAIDASGAAGGISNVVVAQPFDGADTTPPARVTDLFAGLSNASVKIAASIDSVSDELSAARGAAKLIDGNLTTAWQTTAGAVSAPAWVVLDLGKPQPLVRFRTNPSSIDLVGSYPQDFEIQGSADKVAWTPMVHVEGLTGKLGAWNDWSTEVTYARYVRLSITKRGPAAGDAVYAAIGEFEVYALTPDIDADLTWVAPGDDGFAGRAARYDLRRSTVPIDDVSFARADAVATLAPLPGGMIEVLPLGALPSEATLYFALRTVDSTGNWSPVSNVATLKTPGTPPAPVADLAVVTATKESVTLSFTASGDDGLSGRASAYDLRFSTDPITLATWEAALPATPSPAVPQASGSRESVTVAGLKPTTLYYFAVKVVDDVGNRSLISNVAAGATRDGTPPGAIADLVATAVDPATRPAEVLTVADSSGSYSPETQAKNLLDGSDTTEWISPASATLQPLFVELALPASRRLGRLRMRASAQNRDLFPVDFRIEVRAQAGGAWQTVASETGFATNRDGQGQAPDGWEEWMLGSVPAVAVRVAITKPALWTGKYIAAIADLEVFEDPTDYSRLRLSWTSPGDDADRGTAVAYDLRRAAAPITNITFDAATTVAQPPTPQPAGRPERFEVRDLSAETTYCFAIKAADEEGNRGAVSNSSCATTPGMPPATVTDLKVTGTTARTATLIFTAPGADGMSGRADHYEVRRATKRINTATWASATVVANLPTPGVAGATETVNATGLTGLTTYFFAVRAVDGGGNAAPLSNNATGTTLDDVPPSKVTDLAATTNSAQGGSLTLTFTAPGDSGTTGQAKGYDIRVSPTPFVEAAFDSATPVAAPMPSAAGTRETVTITGLGAEQTYTVALRTIDAAGNVSAVSNIVSAATREEAPGAVSDLTVIGGSGRDARNATLILQWTAPGDDDRVGTAQSYDLRYATGTITAATFAQATAVSAMPVPAVAGTVQKVTVSGLLPGVKYSFALKATDDRGNVSTLSNVATGTPPDEVAPAATTDLAAVAGSAPGTLVVALTPPGDDGTDGKATAYDLRWSTGLLDGSSFAAAAPLVAAAPGTPGVKQTFTVTGLPNETEIHLMLRTKDDAGNVSALSNEARASTANVAPAAISDLAIVARGVGTMTLGWTATGDDGKWGTAVAYDLRRSVDPITDATFAAATAVLAPPPGGAGVTESATVSGLDANQTYYFAIKAKDDRGNWSPLSNVLSAATEDTLAPGAIALAAARGTAAGSVVLSWTAPGDDGDKGTAKRYELRRALSTITAGTWAAATPVVVPAPKTAGASESFTVTGLKGEAVHHFMLRAVDEVDNLGPLSNNASAETAPVAPAPMVLAAALTIAGSSASATISWTAPGDDGSEGQATGYEFRYATTPITAANFAAATAVPATVPSPAAAGTAQSFVVGGLREGTTYYFAGRSVDDKETWSALSNIASVTVPDLTRPGAPGGLTVGTPDVVGKRLVPVQVTASTVLGPAWEAANAADDDATSSWASAGSETTSAEELVIDLGAAKSVEQVKVTPDAKYLDLFPRGFRIGVSADARAWKDLVTEQGFVVAAADPIAWGFPAESARYVRVAFDETALSYGKHYVILAEVAVFSAAATDGQAQLTWLAPGDDGLSGKPARYEVFRHTRPFTEGEVGTVTPVSNPPAPGPAGSLQTMIVPALHGETTYYWAVRAVDEAGNVGPLSAVVAGKTNPVAPAAVRTLAGRAAGETSVDLTWTATGDDGLEGVAASYEIRYLAGPLTSQNFASATLVTGLPAPAPAKASQAATVSGLRAGVAYRFGLIAKDAAGNASFLSNIATVTTQSPPDTVAPAIIADLTVATPPAGGKVLSGSVIKKSTEQSADFPATAAADGRVDTFWASAARTVSEEEWVRIEYPTSATVDRVRLWPAAGYPDLFPPDLTVRVSPDGLAWSTAATATNVTAAAGTPVVLTFAPTAIRFVELRATRLARHASGLYYAAVAEVEALTANEPAGTIVATWTSPTDEGPTGRAASYDLRIGACPFAAASSTAVPTSAPRDPATPERARITGLSPGTYCVAIRSTDAAGNNADFSKSAKITLP